MLQFTPSVTYCVRRKTAKWAQISRPSPLDRDFKWLRQSGALCWSRIFCTKNGADEQMRSWAKLLGLEAYAVTSKTITFPWLGWLRFVCRDRDHHAAGRTHRGSSLSARL